VNLESKLGVRNLHAGIPHRRSAVACAFPFTLFLCFALAFAALLPFVLWPPVNGKVQHWSAVPPVGADLNEGAPPQGSSS
jgi:hypothetical protein